MDGAEVGLDEKRDVLKLDTASSNYFFNELSNTLNNYTFLA